MADDSAIQARPEEKSGSANSGRSLYWWQGWVPLVAMPVAVVVFFPSTWPRWAFMWTLAFVIYLGCKWLTWRRTPIQDASIWRHIGYLFLWPGLDAAAFLNPHPSPLPAKPKTSEWLFAVCKLAIGICLLVGVMRFGFSQFPYLAGWVGMIGLVMVLHFGCFHLLSCAWRTVGVQARPLMNWPLASCSISEFWGRRWNTAFRDLTHRFLFRPLITWLGARWAICAGFLFSGIVHDAVISLPAGGGYGGPSLFFALQAAALFIERSSLGWRMGLSRGWCGWLFTMLVLLAPVYCLFHPPFVLDIVVPFLQSMGAV